MNQITIPLNLKKSAMRKMTIHNFEKEEYEGHEIYVRCFNYHFEFLFVHKGNIHAAHLLMKPDFVNHVLYCLRRQELPYSQEQIKACRLLMVRMAQQVIDELESIKTEKTA